MKDISHVSNFKLVCAAAEAMEWAQYYRRCLDAGIARDLDGNAVRPMLAAFEEHIANIKAEIDRRAAREGEELEEATA